MISVQTEDFDVEAEYAALRHRAGDAGAIVLFTGLVRELYGTESHDSQGSDKTQRLFLEHYPGMTEKQLGSISEQASKQWPLLGVRIIHRVGELYPGDQIVLVAAASRHRRAAFESADFIMDFLKSRAPFWKKQTSLSESRWVESRKSDIDALKRWQD
jgi:molybdopterin synthase catalytic subunit